MADSALKARRLADDRRVLVASPDYLTLHGIPEEPHDLAAHRMIAFRDRSPKRLAGPGGATASIDMRTCRLVVDDGASQRAATLAGAGISINSLWSVHADISAGRLVRVLPEWTLGDTSVLWLVYPKSNVLTAKVRVMIDFLIERIGRDPPWAT